MTDSISKLLTAEEFSELPGDNYRELVRGVMQAREGPRAPHAYTQARFIALISNYLDLNPIGTVFGEMGFTTERAPDTVRAPDVSFIFQERQPARRPRGFDEMAPDLAIEILSPSNRSSRMARKIEEYFLKGTRLVWLADTQKRISPSDQPADMERKMAEYFAKGTRLIWVIDPEKNTVAVHTPRALAYVVADGDLLDGGDVLPGFQMTTTKLFWTSDPDFNRRDATG